MTKMNTQEMPGWELQVDEEITNFPYWDTEDVASAARVAARNGQTVSSS